MPDKTWWRCPKCGTMFKHRELIAKQRAWCSYCQEPSMELYDICGLVADWSSGNLNPNKPKETK